MGNNKPPPDNLGKRQQDLNARVNEAFAKNVNFDNVKNETESSELDKFYKIDLAAKCKNVDYIIGVLQAGDTLHVHRALKKCTWIFDDEHSDIVNPEYLENNIFPVTSMRVKRLILKSAIMHMRKEERAIVFYNYCMKIKMTDLALKCLPFTSEEFKLTLLNKQNKILLKNILRKKFTFVQFLIGQSIALLEAFMKMLEKDHKQVLLKLKYFYHVNNNRYLDLVEKYFEIVEDDDNYDQHYISSEVGEHIMKKHKNRVLSRPLFYLELIGHKIVIRNISTEDAKIFIVAFLPSSAEEFWNTNFHNNRAKAFLDFIPHAEKYTFLKGIFNDKYPNEEFETNADFYYDRYFLYMTLEQREEWAINQIKSERQVLGVKKDYLWYEFINFEHAFDEIKKYIIVTKEREERLDMLKTLVKAVRSNRDLEILFKYYSKRHINEAALDKAEFLNEVIYNQNIFEFDDACWTQFYTLLLSMKIYYEAQPPIEPITLEFFKNTAVFYHVLNEKEMPDDLKSFFLNHFYPCSESFDHASVNPLIDKLNDEKRMFLFNYMYTFYSDKINEYKNKPYTIEDISKAKRYMSVLLTLHMLFNLKHVEAPTKRYRRKQCKRDRATHPPISDTQLLLDLKKDTSILDRKVSLIKMHLKETLSANINKFLRKIKIYFPDDVTDKFLNMYEEIVDQELKGLSLESIDTCINGVFELGNEESKLNLMKKYCPENAIINCEDYPEIEILNIRRAICRHACNSMPPMPLPSILTYLKGDYAHFCLHIFSKYIATLPTSSCAKLAETFLDSPVSIQKHALRLAVQSFSEDSLKGVVKDIWQKTKNVSLRSVMYKALFNRIACLNEIGLHEILISFTLDLNEDDQKVVFNLVQSDALPKDFLGEYKKATWKSIGVFNDKEPNISRKKRIIKGITMHLNIMDKEFVKTIIDQHLNTMFAEDKLELNYSEEDIAMLYIEKWNLTGKFIVTSSFDDPRKSVELAKHIVNNCLKMWNEKRSDKYVYQYCCWEFLQNLFSLSIEYYKHFESIIPIFECIPETLQEALPLHEIYMPKWEIELAIAHGRVIKNNADTFENHNKNEVVRESTMRLGKEVGKLVTDYVANKMYYVSFSEKIKDLVVRWVKDLMKIVFSSVTECIKYLSSALTNLAVALIEFETMETFLLAVQVLPSNIDDCDEYTRDKYQFVIDTVLNCPHAEAQSAAHQKAHKPLKRSAKTKKQNETNSNDIQRQRMRHRGRGRRVRVRRRVFYD